MDQACPVCGGASFWNVIHGFECMTCRSLLDKDFSLIRKGPNAGDAPKHWIRPKQAKKITKITQDEEHRLRRIVEGRR